MESILTDFSADKIKGFHKKEKLSQWNSVAGGHARGTCHVYKKSIVLENTVLLALLAKGRCF